MNPPVTINKVKLWLICVLVLCIFILGFHLLSILSFKAKDSYLTILDKGLFEAEASNRDDNHFAIYKMIKFTAPFHMLDSDLLDMNTVVFTSSNPAGKQSVHTGLYDLSTSRLSYQFDQQNQIAESNISVSNDGNSILVSYEDNAESKTDGLSKAYLFDASTYERKSIYKGVFEAKWLPDSVRFVGIDDYLFIQDINSGMRENLVNISDYAGTIPKSYLGLELLKDGRTAIIWYNDAGIAHLLRVDLTTGDQAEQTLSESLFYPFPIDNNALAVTGLFNNQYGIYLYDVSTQSPELLVDLTKQKLFEMSVSQDGKKIAYSVMNMTTGVLGTEVHAAYLDNNRVTNDVVVYRDINHFVDKLIWTKDSQILYGFQRNSDYTDIFRILFK